jgi:DNA recombination protein RmuC
MNTAALFAMLAALLVGGAIGALLMWLACARRLQTQEALRDQLKGAFGDMARDSLQSNSEVFLQLAAERLARQQQAAAQALTEREVAIDTLVKPLREALTRSEAQIQQLESARVGAFASLRSEVEALALGQNLLSRETRNLVTALRRPDVRGQWGEITLRRVVEMSGMTEHVDFTEQHHQATATGAIRPDMIVHMPERRDIVVDVKTPLDAYLSAVEAQDDEQRAKELRRHAQIVASRIRELAGKQYWAQFENSPDFVVLFLPGDQFLAAAVQENPALIEEALRQNVMLATPTSLSALLKVIEYGWKQSRLADNAADVRKLGEELYKRLAVFAEHLGRLGKSLSASVDAYNKSVGSLEGQVLPGARRFPELGLRTNREIDALEPVEELVRMPRPTEPPSLE